MTRRPNKSRYAILGILMLGPRSGYDIKKFFDRTVANFWNESYGQIYPILKRLAAEGLVEKSIEKQAGKPDRHIYTITGEGRNEMREWLMTPVGPQIGRQFHKPAPLIADVFSQRRISQQHRRLATAPFRLFEFQPSLVGVQGLERFPQGPDIPRNSEFRH